MQSRPTRLFVILAGFFITNALLAEFIGMKIFSFEPTVGIEPLNWSLFGQSGTLMLSAGVLLWPVVFITTDIVNEYFGKKGVQLLSYLTAGLISYAFLMVVLAINLVPADFWVADYADKGVPDMQVAYSQVFGQGIWIIIGSLIAFLVGQVVDATVFEKLRIWSGDRMIWLRATGSTLVSQLLDSFLVLYIAFVLGPPQWDTSLFLAVGTVNYTYKFFVAILLTPIIYLMRYVIDGYLGETAAEEMKRRAIGTENQHTG